MFVAFNALLFVVVLQEGAGGKYLLSVMRLAALARLVLVFEDARRGRERQLGGAVYG